MVIHNRGLVGFCCATYGMMFAPSFEIESSSGVFVCEWCFMLCSIARRRGFCDATAEVTLVPPFEIDLGQCRDA